MQEGALRSLAEKARKCSVSYGFAQAIREADIAIHALMNTGRFSVVRSCDSGELVAGRCLPHTVNYSNICITAFACWFCRSIHQGGFGIKNKQTRHIVDMFSE